MTQPSFKIRLKVCTKRHAFDPALLLVGGLLFEKATAPPAFFVLFDEVVTHRELNRDDEILSLPKQTMPLIETWHIGSQINNSVAC